MSRETLPHYALGSTDAEHHRLVQLASHEEDRVADACRRAGVGEGATALDLGCGPLGALSALATVVGARGTVIGIDASVAALGRASDLVGHHRHVRLLHADVNEVEPHQIGTVADLAYARLFLLHQADPARTLRNVARLLRAGGVVIAHEASDLLAHAPASEPHVPAMTRVWELVIGAARARGANTGFARNGRQCLEAAGLVVESHRAYAVHYPPETGFDIPRRALHSLRPSLLQYGLSDDAEIARLDAELAEAMHAPGVQWVSSPWMIEWIARVP